MPLAVLLAENDTKLWKTPRSQKGLCYSGIILRQIWNICAFLLVAAFCSVLKSSLIKEREPTVLKWNHEIPESDIPVFISSQSKSAFEAFSYSPYYIDRWIFENTKKVFYFGR